MSLFSKMIIVSFDIGFRNLAWASVWFHDANITIDLSKGGIITPEMETLMVDNMNVLNMDVFDACKEAEKPMEIYKNIHRYLSTMEYVWSSADMIVVEQQMSTGKIFNIKAIKISQHILAYFMIRHPLKKIIELGAGFKTSLFGHQFSKKKLRKDWAIEKVYQLLEADPVATNMIDLFPKKDDVCDCVLMCFVYFFKNLVAS